ncbi:MAG: 1-acyl-sn-glycerol-3-phosphate acyltransferase [Candidatus Obscuribacterales bacterium]|nr:1-acyl-sn-glycerol-3-phosphate acyltransferase [Candidatus Obscuribacterales bacterium]
MSQPCFRWLIERAKQAWNDWRRRFRVYAEHCLESGFIPQTFGPIQALARYAAKLVIYIQLGRLRIIGKENLQRPGRLIFCPNHSSMFDAIVLYALFNRKESVRYMTAYEEMRGLYGIKAVVMGALGCFPVDRTKGKSVIEPAVEVLVNGQCLTIFPEGKISVTGVCQPVKKGAAIIATAAQERLGNNEQVGIVPMSICYHKRDVPTATKNFWQVGMKWRGGITVTVGKPLYINELKGLSVDEIMEQVRQFICQSIDTAELESLPEKKINAA